MRTTHTEQRREEVLQERGNGDGISRRDLRFQVSQAGIMEMLPWEHMQNIYTQWSSRRTQALESMGSLETSTFTFKRRHLFLVDLVEDTVSSTDTLYTHTDFY